MQNAGKVNIRGIVDLDQLAVVLENLVNNVNHQNIVISDLELKLSQFVTKQAFNESNNMITEKISKLEKKMDQILTAATAKYNGKTIAAGDLATINNNTIQKLTETLAECITRPEVEFQYQQLYEIRTTNMKIQKDLTASILMNDQLTKSHAGLAEKVQLIETLLPTKLDRSELGYLESIVAKMSLYDAFRADTTTQLDALEVFRKSAGLSLSAHDHHLRSVDHFCGGLSDELKLLARQSDLRELEAQVLAHERKLPSFALQSDLNKVEKALERTHNDLAKAAQNIALIDVAIKDTNSVVATKATIREVRECVTRKHYEEVVSALGEDLATKASQLSAEELRSQIQEMQARIESESERTSVAVRFVDWFTNRGENYEHNMKVIDRHLKGLVTPEVAPRMQTYMPISKIKYSSLSSELYSEKPGAGIDTH